MESYGFWWYYGWGAQQRWSLLQQRNGHQQTIVYTGLCPKKNTIKCPLIFWNESPRGRKIQKRLSPTPQQTSNKPVLKQQGNHERCVCVNYIVLSGKNSLIRADVRSRFLLHRAPLLGGHHFDQNSAILKLSHFVKFLTRHRIRNHETKDDYETKILNLRD